MARRSGSTPTAGSRPAAGTRRWRHSRTWWPPRERCGMEAAEIRITAEPIDNQRCKFVVSVPVWAGGVRRFTDADEAKGSPLAEAIFAIPGLAVSELIVSGNIITVVKQSPAPWQAVGKSIGAAIRAAVASGVPAVAASPKPPGAVNDDAL